MSLSCLSWKRTPSAVSDLGISLFIALRQEKTHCDVKVLCVTGSLLAIYTRPSYKTHRGWERQLSIETDYAEKPLEWHFSCVKRDKRTAFDPAKLCKWQCLLGQ